MSYDSKRQNPPSSNVGISRLGLALANCCATGESVNCSPTTEKHYI